ncbi:methyltransferase-like protein 25B [Ptychodera flava]|uniref:methyltransferase-like protein 25B n=1 Tax=Ptychodera flava TaxID=63121 RepID=UPI00396A5C39
MALRCDPDSYQLIQNHAKNLLCFVNQYKWISEAYIVEFFVKDHWANLPGSWQDVLQDFDTEQMASLLSGQPMNNGTIFQRVWPLSLLSFRAAAYALPLPRILCEKDETFDHVEVQNLLRKAQTSYEPLPHHYRRHVKPKKQYEIFRLAKLINEVCTDSRCLNLVDVGAGLGHLTRLLSFGYGLHVTTVEADGCNVTGAIKLDSKLTETIQVKRVENPSKLKGVKLSESASDDPNIPSHVIFHINANIAADDFLNLLQENHGAVLLSDREERQTIVDKRLNGSITSADNNKSTVSGNENAKYAMSEQNLAHAQQTVSCDDKSFVFAGLHTCGDLAPTILRVFTRCKTATALVSVGCCYQRMTCRNVTPAKTQCNRTVPTDSQAAAILDTGNPRTTAGIQNSSQPQGYPMSTWVNHIPNHELNYEPRELACHAVDTYAQRLRDGDPNIILQCYRAILETIIQKQHPELSTGHASIRKLKKIMRNVKKQHDVPLNQYLSEALSKLGLEQVSIDESKELEKLLARWKQLIAFHVVRLLTAPVIESLILIDRMLYLYEQGFESQLIPVFNPKMSPRNFVLISKKTSPQFQDLETL